jgi:hypothetical protein
MCDPATGRVAHPPRFARTSHPERRTRAGAAVTIPRELVHVFLFFSNRLGCLGSLLVSVILTVVLLLLLGVL